MKILLKYNNLFNVAFMLGLTLFCTSCLNKDTDEEVVLPESEISVSRTNISFELDECSHDDFYEEIINIENLSMTSFEDLNIAVDFENSEPWFSALLVGQQGARQVKIETMLNEVFLIQGVYNATITINALNAESSKTINVNMSVGPRTPGMVPCCGKVLFKFVFEGGLPHGEHIVGATVNYNSMTAPASLITTYFGRFSTAELNSRNEIQKCMSTGRTTYWFTEEENCGLPNIAPLEIIISEGETQVHTIVIPCS